MGTKALHLKKEPLTIQRRVIFCLRGFFLLLALGGCVWFVLPVFKGGYNVGCVFGQLLCVAGGSFALITGRWKKRWLNMAVYVLLGVFVLVLGWCGFLTVQINSAQTNREIPPGTTVAVLGARVLTGGEPSASLRTRLDAAIVQLEKDPSARCIVTGGKGADEPITEAQASKDYLVKMGIDSSRIYLEDKSVNTKENMMYSRQITKEKALGDELCIATQGFHQYRSALLAKDAGFTASYALVAHTNPMLYPGYYGRELLSLTNYYLRGVLNFRGDGD